MKISIIIPTYNEEKNIILLLQSLINQSYLADEIVICDGGSKDNTIKLINNFIKDYTFIKLVPRLGKCRGAGRNTGINFANNQYLALIDAGTIPVKDWLENLVKPIIDNNNNKIVYGVAKPIISSSIEIVIGSIVISKKNYEGIIFPTVSSLLINKEIWKIIGKFPESKSGNYIVEDLIFLEKLKKFKKYSVSNYQAIVNWQVPNNYYDVFKRFSTYSRGGLISGFAKTWHYGVFRNYIIYIIIVFFSLLINNFSILLIILSLFLLRAYSYLKYLQPILKMNLFKYVYRLFISFTILLVIDIATFYGLILWVIKDKLRLFFKND